MKTKSFKPPEIDEQKRQKFMDEYAKLCNQHGLQIAFSPIWKMSNDTGTYSLVIQPIIVSFQVQETKEKT